MTTTTCTKCGNEFPLADLRDGRKSGHCRDCKRAQQRAWRKRNVEKARGYCRAYHDRNRDEMRARWRAWYYGNREEILKYNATPDRKRQLKINTRVSMFGKRYGEKLTDEAKDTLIIVDADPCAYCGASANTADHIDRRAKNAWDNFTAACNTCNAQKGGLSLLMYLSACRIRSERDALQNELRTVLNG